MFCIFYLIIQILFSQSYALMTKQEIQIKLGEKIIKLRQLKGLKQIELAHKLDIEDSALRRIEKGRTNTTLWMMQRICDALEISFPELVNFDE